MDPSQEAAEDKNPAEELQAHLAEGGMCQAAGGGKDIPVGAEDREHDDEATGTSQDDLRAGHLRLPPHLRDWAGHPRLLRHRKLLTHR